MIMDNRPEAPLLAPITGYALMPVFEASEQQMGETPRGKHCDDSVCTDVITTSLFFSQSICHNQSRDNSGACVNDGMPGGQ